MGIGIFLLNCLPNQQKLYIYLCHTITVSLVIMVISFCHPYVGGFFMGLWKKKLRSVETSEGGLRQAQPPGFSKNSFLRDNLPQPLLKEGRKMSVII